MLENLSSAAVVIGVLRVLSLTEFNLLASFLLSTLCLLVSSADNLCKKKMDPVQARQFFLKN